jgi:hypothetical protein
MSKSTKNQKQRKNRVLFFRFNASAQRHADVSENGASVSKFRIPCLNILFLKLIRILRRPGEEKTLG